MTEEMRHDARMCAESSWLDCADSPIGNAAEMLMDDYGYRMTDADRCEVIEWLHAELETNRRR